MDRPRDYHTKSSQMQKDKQPMVLLIVGKFFIYKCAYLQNSNRLMYLKKQLMVGGGAGRRDRLGVWD